MAVVGVAIPLLVDDDHRRLMELSVFQIQIVMNEESRYIFFILNKLLCAPKVLSAGK